MADVIPKTPFPQSRPHISPPQPWPQLRPPSQKDLEACLSQRLRRACASGNWGIATQVASASTSRKQLAVAEKGALTTSSREWRSKCEESAMILDTQTDLCWWGLSNKAMEQKLTQKHPTVGGAADVPISTVRTMPMFEDLKMLLPWVTYAH
ncbi:hypothetical protein MLD38_035451 [Melastoma candidum]|uniref:Uncharacterized protein n=1 Tax=Melastoma candidum TaxID=119954 RepID=A0ACB9LIG1_9MYRT|nr:hypothetical protein MLD38_035451 [Melastoma candidum]